MTAKLESQQRLIAHLKDQNTQLHLRITNLEQRNLFLENQNRELGGRVQSLLTQSRDYDLPHTPVRKRRNGIKVGLIRTTQRGLIGT